MTLDWNSLLVDQLDWHWRAQARPRLDGLTDAEFAREPAPGCWSVRPRAQASAPELLGAGEYALEYGYPVPQPPPVTTIAWRLAHVIVGVFGTRSASHFGGPPMTWQDFEYAGTAAGALAQLDAAYGTWIAGVRALGAEGLARPCGPAEGPFAQSPLAELVLHINRDAIHHLAEVALLLDLYRAGG